MAVKEIKVIDVSDWVGPEPKYDEGFYLTDKFNNLPNEFILKYLNVTLYCPKEFINQEGVYNRDNEILSDIYTVGYDSINSQLYRLRLLDEYSFEFEAITLDNVCKNNLLLDLNKVNYIDLDQYINVSLEIYSKYTNSDKIKLSQINGALVPTNKKANIVKIENNYVYLPPTQGSGYTQGYFDYKGKSYLINILGNIAGNGGMVSIVNLYDDVPVINISVPYFNGEDVSNSSDLTNYFVDNKPKQISFNLNNKKYVGALIKDEAVDPAQGLAAELYYTFINNENEICLLKVVAGPTGVNTTVRFTVDKLTISKSNYTLDIKSSIGLGEDNNEYFSLDDTESSKIKQFVNSGKRFENAKFTFTFGYDDDGYGNISGIPVDLEYISSNLMGQIPTYYFRGYYNNSIILVTLKVPTEFPENVSFNKNVVGFNSNYTLDLKTTETLATLANKNLSTEDSNKFKTFINSGKNINDLIINMNFGYYDDGTGDIFGDVVKFEYAGKISKDVNDGYCFKAYYNNKLILMSLHVPMFTTGQVYYSTNVIG